MRALVVGGTGPTGPLIVKGLLERGYRVTVLHRGIHESPDVPREVERLRADPHFRETLDAALEGRCFDLAIATYGRLRHVAAALVGKTPRLVAVSGFPCYRGYSRPEATVPAGMPIPCPESAPVVTGEDEARFSYLVAQGEQAVMRHHHEGAYSATLFRYPFLYGPRQPIPREWCVIRRILDRRPRILLPGSGLTIIMRGYAGNVAHALLLAVDRPATSAGQTYNCGDERQLTLRQWVETIAHTLGHEWEIVDLPGAVTAPALALMPLGGHLHHRLLSLTKLREDLGYRDLVPVEEALPATVRWYLEHPPGRGGELEQRLQDAFDYAAEDRLAALAEKCLEHMQQVTFARSPTFHAYAHPKTTGLDRDHRGR